MVMNIELGHLPDGNPLIVSDSAFPAVVKRAEYYKDQRLILLVYDSPDQDSDLMHYELNDDHAARVSAAPSLILITAEPGQELKGYDVPIIQIGDY